MHIFNFMDDIFWNWFLEFSWKVHANTHIKSTGIHFEFSGLEGSLGSLRIVDGGCGVEM